MDLVERVQYKAALFLGAGKGLIGRNCMTSLAGSLCLIADRRRLTIFYKIHNDHTPSYLSDHIPRRNVIDIYLRNRNENPPLIRTERYEDSFFLYTIKSWKNLDNEAKSKPSVQSFKMYLNNYIRPLGHSLFGIGEIFGIKLLTKIRVGFSDLRVHRFNHNFTCVSRLVWF